MKEKEINTNFYNKSFLSEKILENTLEKKENLYLLKKPFIEKYSPNSFLKNIKSKNKGIDEQYNLLINQTILDYPKKPLQYTPNYVPSQPINPTKPSIVEVAEKIAEYENTIFEVQETDPVVLDDESNETTESVAMEEVAAIINKQNSVEVTEQEEVIEDTPKVVLYPKFAAVDPFAENSARYTRALAKKAGFVRRYLQGSGVEAIQLVEIGLGEGANVLLDNVNKTIDQLYNKFVATVAKNPHVSQVDKKDASGQEVGVKVEPLVDKIRGLIARFIIQSDCVDPGWFNASQLPTIYGVLESGFEAYLNVHKVDIPFYDKVYAEFDEMREAGRFPQEVYLGRDGVYAYDGRRALDIARRRRNDWVDRVVARAIGTPIEAKVKYLVYPRYYRDGIDVESKRVYLGTQGVEKAEDPFFYDTGFTGTIPVQIMDILGMTVNDREERIRLLSANQANRRVRGMNANARSEIVNQIEYNAKLDESSTGIFQDQETGEVRPISKPTTPVEQFTYMMVRQALVRHYYIKESLEVKKSSSSVMRFEQTNHRYLVDKEYSKFLPAQFLVNPDQYIADHCVVVKSSDADSKYQNELVVVMTLNNGEEVIVKKVELGKVKEAKNEYVVLQRAQKAELPAPRPVGFLEGQGEEDSSYVIMAKLEGISGRKFEKYLRGSGKYLEAEINELMADVAAKQRELVKEFREKLRVDKPWRIKDLMVDFDEQTGVVKGVSAIDFERARYYDPANPHSVK